MSPKDVWRAGITVELADGAPVRVFTSPVPMWLTSVIFTVVVECACVRVCVRAQVYCRGKEVSPNVVIVSSRSEPKLIVTPGPAAYSPVPPETTSRHPRQPAFSICRAQSDIAHRLEQATTPGTHKYGYIDIMSLIGQTFICCGQGRPETRFIKATEMAVLSSALQVFCHPVCIVRLNLRHNFSLNI
jgi:Sperm-tail PG-rich repeat